MAKKNGGQPDRASTLRQIPPELHPVAEHLAAQGLDWGSIAAIILQVLPALISAFKKKPITP